MPDLCRRGCGHESMVGSSFCERNECWFPPAPVPTVTFPLSTVTRELPPVVVLPAAVPSFSPQIGESGRSTGTTMHAPLPNDGRMTGLVTHTDPPGVAHLTIARELREAKEEIVALKAAAVVAVRTLSDGVALSAEAADHIEALEAEIGRLRAVADAWHVELEEEREAHDRTAAVLNACRHYLPSARFKVKGKPRRDADALLKAHIERRK